ncbi:hypothetical protein [Malonomonas rubra]|nr:hypothetical protein [Malonomonas rubra]
MRWDTKDAAESQHRIDIRWLKKNNYLRPGISGTLSWSRGDEQTGWIRYTMEHDRMNLRYRYRRSGEEWQDIEQSVYFDHTPCNYGGSRKWFLCPHCHKRIAVIYGAGKYFLCRHCYDLTYSSQQENPADRLIRKARKIRKDLGGDDSLTDAFPEKPKHMHWKTYWRLRDEATHAENAGWLWIAEKFGIHF